MKVIFLDIDGVMVTGSYQRPSTHYNGYQFNPSCVENLKQIMKQTGASIVVSSTWRKAGFRFLKQMFTANGIDKGLVGQTPVLVNRDRGDEIQQYIEEAQLDPSFTVEQFVILDDHNDMGKLLPYLVQTDGHTGLDQEATKRAIKMLS